MADFAQVIPSYDNADNDNVEKGNQKSKNLVGHKSL